MAKFVMKSVASGLKFDLKAGNGEFGRAADETMAALRSMNMEEVDWFMERMGQTFRLTLDDLG